MSTTTRLALGLAVVLLPLVVLRSEDEPTAGEISRGLDGWSLAVLVAASLGLLLARRYPGTGVVTLMVLTTWWYQLGHTSGLINPFVLVAFYKLGHTGDRRRQFGVGVPAVVIPFITAILFSGEPFHEQVAALDWPIDALAWPIVAMLLGEMVLNRQQLLDEYERRAETAEAERDAEAERRVAEERLRIARDVHDVLAHTVAVMHVQAGAAADTLDRDPDAARSSLANIRAAGKEAMNEVRATVAILREGSGPSIDTGPTPGLDQLEGLVEATRRSGLEIRFRIDVPGHRRAADGGDTGGQTDTGDGDAAGGDAVEEPEAGGPPGPGDGRQRPDSLTELTAYRVVQEALTNVRRHAVDPGSVDVAVVRKTGALVVEIVDDGRPTRSPASGGPPAGTGAAGDKTPNGNGDERRGYGLRGMRERVESLGGTLEVGPRPGCGWRVHASLPLRKAGS